MALVRSSAVASTSYALGTVLMRQALSVSMTHIAPRTASHAKRRFPQLAQAALNHRRLLNSVFQRRPQLHPHRAATQVVAAAALLCYRPANLSASSWALQASSQLRLVCGFNTSRTRRKRKCGQEVRHHTL